METQAEQVLREVHLAAVEAVTTRVAQVRVPLLLQAEQVRIKERLITEARARLQARVVQVREKEIK